MLDSETKARIDSARDILVGKVPDPKSQVEQITIALIYKFMDDMDRQSEELGGKATFFSGEYKKYAWNQLLDKRLGGHERLLLYAEGIEKMNENKNIPQLFRDIFRGVFLPYRDPETLNLFLKEINGFTYDHSERLGDAYEHLLNVLGTQGDAGQFRTPRHIIDFIVTIVDPQKHETVLDPACGTAGFLISAYKHILKHNENLSPDERGRLMASKLLRLRHRARYGAPLQSKHVSPRFSQSGHPRIRRAHQRGTLGRTLRCDHGQPAFHDAERWDPAA
jgi:type I restriction enzyme M protein